MDPGEANPDGENPLRDYGSMMKSNIGEDEIAGEYFDFEL